MKNLRFAFLHFKILFVFQLLILGSLFSEDIFVDLESKIQDFVLETKQITIPGYPHAFNASVVRWHDALLMSFRIIPDPSKPFTSYIGVVWLDDNFDVISEPQVLDFRGKHIQSQSRAEDARLVMVGERLFMVYDDNIDKILGKSGFRVYLCELVAGRNQIAFKNVEGFFQFEGASPERREKAWVPFDYHENLLLAYSIDPHVVFYPMLGTGECTTVAKTQPPLSWTWGEIRGGTPALLIDENHYLSFFHSSLFMPTVHSNGKNMTHYFMGAYVFNTEPPFGITHVSPEPIFGKNFYNGPVYKHYWKPIRAVFPCGYVFDERYIWITYGRDDHEIWVVRLDKEGLLQSLVPVH